MEIVYNRVARFYGARSHAFYNLSCVHYCKKKNNFVAVAVVVVHDRHNISKSKASKNRGGRSCKIAKMQHPGRVHKEKMCKIEVKFALSPSKEKGEV